MIDWSKRILTPAMLQGLLKTTPLDGIHTLVLDMCQLGDAGVEVLVETLVELLPSSLKRICLRQNQISSNGAQALGRLIQALPSLQSLRLSHNLLGDDGMAPIFSALLYSDSDQELQELSLGSNQLTAAGTSSMQAALAEIRGLHTLILDKNALGDEGVANLVQGIVTNRRLCLQTLSLQQTQIEHVNVARLASLITCGKIWNLHLHDNRIDDDGAQTLLTAILESDPLQANVEGLHTNVQVTPEAQETIVSQIRFLCDEAKESHKTLLTQRGNLEVKDRPPTRSSTVVPVSRNNPNEQRRSPPPTHLYQHDPRRSSTTLLNNSTTTFDIQTPKPMPKLKVDRHLLDGLDGNTRALLLKQASDYDLTIISDLTWEHGGNSPVASSQHRKQSPSNVKRQPEASANDASFAYNLEILLQGLDHETRQELQDAFPNPADLYAFLTHEMGQQSSASQEPSKPAAHHVSSTSRPSTRSALPGVPFPDRPPPLQDDDILNSLDQATLTELRQIFPDEADLRAFLKSDEQQHNLR